MTKLQTLDLADAQVTDAGLKHLHGLTQLKVLYFGGTKVTEAGIQELQEALPKANINR